MAKFIPGSINPARSFQSGSARNVTTPFQTPNTSLGQSSQTLNINPYSCQAYDLTNAFVGTEIPVAGTTIWVVYATANTALAYVSFELPSNDLIPIYPTFKMDGFPFSKFYLNNPIPQAGVTIYIFTSTDKNAALPIAVES